jgi:hypothetical protein
LLRTDNYRTVARIAFLVTLTVVLVLALSPGWFLQGLGLGFTSHHDKLNHAAAFAVLAVLGSFGWPEHRTKLIVFLAFTGAAIELLQGTHLIARDMDILDWVADCAGVACGLTAAGWTKRFVRASP